VGYRAGLRIARNTPISHEDMKIREVLFEQLAQAGVAFAS